MPTAPALPAFRAEDIDGIDLPVGQARTLESLRQAVVPPFILVVPFVELPAGVQLVRQDRLDEDGVHGCVFTLMATSPGIGELRVGFRDLRSGQVLRDKRIAVRAR